MRELVLVADVHSYSQEHLAALARRAADTDHLEEVTAEEMGFAMGRLVPGGRAARSLADHKQPVTLDISDSDDFGEGPLLGRVARLRRARSAVSREGGGLRLHLDDGYSSSTASSFDAGSPCAAPAPAPQHKQQPPQPPPQQQAEPAPGGNGKKHRHKHRPKTAKPNRVAPSSDAPPRRGASAGPKASDNPLSGSGSGSGDSQDPLEPWSVRGIEPMNALLAWDQGEHDSM
ncbi:WAS/WASL-interacting protein family member 1-like [Thrips palmi]|uniref:WAS/WASL-interacting protein family member 1-like n=1 Tax=Thrips palmi TaxID=161013 RepID=A0A6P8YSZ6_THRPL|nr:WAS/WASL-interacting protein family member 1-like [Thrips palmi]